MVIEQTGVFHGVYHVLRDLIDAGDEESFTRIKAKELLSRIEGKSTFNKEVLVKEVIVALNPDLAGETTALFLEQEIKAIAPKVKVTRLARGLPLGADLRYADEVTLGSAIKNRTSKS
jgi:recombination protein RecR